MTRCSGPKYGDFQVVGLLSAGSHHGLVYLATGPTKHTQTQGYVALKVANWKNNELVAELQAEARHYDLLRTLQGDVIPRLVFAGFAEKEWFVLASSFVGQRTFKDVLEKGCDSKDRAMYEAAREKLQRMHGLGLLHNDLRPENIVLDDKDNPVFVDLSFSKVCSPVSSESDADSSLNASTSSDSCASISACDPFERELDLLDDLFA